MLCIHGRDDRCNNALVPVTAIDQLAKPRIVVSGYASLALKGLNPLGRRVPHSGDHALGRL